MLRSLLIASAVVAAGVVLPPSLAQAQEAAPTAEQTYQEIERTLGVVPSFFKAFPEAGIAGAWQEFKTIQMSPDTALSGKEKELIGLAVAAQIPCTYCVKAHTEFARLNGATDQEIQEAIAMAAITRHWSTVLNGSQIDPAQFDQDVGQIVARAQEQMKAAGTESVQ